MCYSCDYYNTTGNDVCGECGFEYAPMSVPIFTDDEIQDLVDNIESQTYVESVEDEDEKESAECARAHYREVKRMENW